MHGQPEGRRELPVEVIFREGRDAAQRVQIQIIFGMPVDVIQHPLHAVALADDVGQAEALQGAAELADRTGLDERWVREWAYNQAAARQAPLKKGAAEKAMTGKLTSQQPQLSNWRISSVSGWPGRAKYSASRSPTRRRAKCSRASRRCCR